MVDDSRSGVRVEIKPDTVTFYRKYKNGEQGRIVSELVNKQGWRLLDVKWDAGYQSPVFEKEVIIL